MPATLAKIFMVFLMLAVARRLTAAPIPEQELRLSNGSEPRELDPGKAVGVPEHRILSNLFEGLLTQDGRQDQPVPGVASDWQQSSDGLIYTFHLRPDAKWSDGYDVEAADFVFAYQRMLTPAFAAEYAYELFYIKNAQAYYDGRVTDFAQVGIKALDSHTLRLELTSPTPFFLSLLSEDMLAPVPRHLLTKLPAGADWTKPGVMVSNGPFQLEAWRLNTAIALVPNPHYWDRQAVSLRRVTFLPIESPDTADKAFFAGDIAMTDDVPGLKIPVYRGRHDSHPSDYDPFRVAPSLSTYFYFFNTQAAPFTDRRVRQALAMTIDRTLLVQKVTRAGEAPLTAFCPFGIRTYEPQGPLAPSVDAAIIGRARALLREAGYPNPSEMPPIQLHYNTSDNNKRVALAMQQMWRKTLGIKVELVNEEWKVYQNTQHTHAFQISRYGWTGDYLDPNTFLELLTTSSGNNNTGWSSPRFDALLKAANAAVSISQRQDLYRQAEEILLAEMPVLPLYTATSRHLVAPSVQLRMADGKLLPWRSTQLDSMVMKHWVLAEPLSQAAGR